MNFDEMFCFARLFALAMGGSYPKKLSEREMDMACELLKKMADNSANWTLEQKEMYKLMVDYAKRQAKGY